MNAPSAHAALKPLIAGLDERYPLMLVDVGAMGGIARKWDVLGEAVKVLAFEADEREYQKLKSTDRVQYLNYLVHGRSEDLIFHISKAAGKSSVYPPNMPLLDRFPLSDRFTVVDQLRFPASRVRSFDDLVKEGVIDDLDFIKLDTEGTELSILQGAQKHVLPGVFGVQLEVEFVEKCLDQPLFRQVDECMAVNGFQLMDLRRQYWKRKEFGEYIGKGQLVFGDVLYVKTVEAFAAAMASMELARAKAKIQKAILICLVYRLCDHAMVLCQWAKEQGYLNTAEYEQAVAVIRDYARCGIVPQFPGREFLYKVFAKLAEYLRPMSYKNFSDGDRTIANIRDI